MEGKDSKQKTSSTDNAPKKDEALLDKIIAKLTAAKK